MSAMLDLELRTLGAGDSHALARVDGGNGWDADAQLWDSYLSEQTAGERVVMVAWSDGRPVGYGALVWASGYRSFRSKGIPEINNLSVASAHRGRGVATRLIRHLEGLARHAGRTQIGLGFGLYADYGPAQRLYVGLGYRPDGHGVSYADEPVRAGAAVCLDDELILWLTRAL